MDCSPINLLGNRERTGNKTATYVLTVLAVLFAWVSLMSFDQPLIAANIIGTSHGQRELPSSGASTPFLEWYERQGTSLQVTNPLAVKIESPATGQQVPSGQSLIVSGVSSDNSTSDCEVSVIVNGIRPYQPSFANGTGGINDYSTWNLWITPSYTTIKEGSDNKITSKLECTPNLTKWYSVNVTGVGTTSIVDRAGTAMQAPLPPPTSSFEPDNNIPDRSLLPDEDSESDEDSDNDVIDDTLFDENSESDEDSESDEGNDNDDLGELFE